MDGREVRSKTKADTNPGNTELGLLIAISSSPNYRDNKDAEHRFIYFANPSRKGQLPIINLNTYVLIDASLK